MNAPFNSGRTSSLTLQLAANDKQVKVSKRLPTGQTTKPLVQLDAATLRRRSDRVRCALGQLNTYVRGNPLLCEERNSGWIKYAEIMRELQEAGEGLRNAFLGSADKSNCLETAIQALGPGGEFTIHFDDGDLTMPLGFCYDGVVNPPVERPCRAHFKNFWLSRLRITFLVENGGCESEKDLQLDPDSFSALFALHRNDYDGAAEELDDDNRAKLKRLLKLPLKDHYDWNSASKAWDDAGHISNIVFVLAHSDGDMLRLSNSSLDSGSFAKRFSRTEFGPATLLVLNCCMSAAGAAGTSLLSAVARPGFSGLVGTEFEILNSHALRCGTRLMWELCANGKTLGEAFESLQQDDSPEVFPLNLFYSCYAHRDFRLQQPIKQLMDA